MPFIVHNNTNLSLTRCALGRAPYDLHVSHSKTMVELRLELRSDSRALPLHYSALITLLTRTMSITHIHSVLQSSEETRGTVTLLPLFRLGSRLRGQLPSQGTANKHGSQHMNLDSLSIHFLNALCFNYVQPTLKDQIPFEDPHPTKLLIRSLYFELLLWSRPCPTLPSNAGIHK